MNVLVTGGSGFIGTRLVERLINAGHAVRIFDKATSVTYPDLVIRGDVRDARALESVMQGIEAVFHLAAEHRDDVKPTELYYQVNVQGTANVAAEAARRRIRRIVFASSVALYGLDKNNPSEDDGIDPFNDYGKSKYEAEEALLAWAKNDKRNCLAIVRPTVVFGEGNRGNVFNLLEHIASGKFVMIGNGENRKSMAYVGNIVAFLSHLIDLNSGCMMFNYADKPDLTTREIVRIANDAMGRPMNKGIAIPYSVGMAAGYCFDVLARVTGKTLSVSSVRVKKFCAETTVSTKRLQDHGFIAPHSLEEGLRRMIASDIMGTVSPFNRI
jgi:nucleoside-diphosphate-sugar epimerase